MVVCIAFAVAFNIVRVFEFRSLNVWWDTNAYGSVVWTLLGLHTTISSPICWTRWCSRS